MITAHLEKIIADKLFFLKKILKEHFEADGMEVLGGFTLSENLTRMKFEAIDCNFLKCSQKKHTNVFSKTKYQKHNRNVRSLTCIYSVLRFFATEGRQKETTIWTPLIFESQWILADLSFSLGNPSLYPFFEKGFCIV